MLSITFPRPWEDEGELVLHLLEDAALLTELNALVRSRETSAQSGWSLRRFLIPYTMFSAPPGMPHTKLHRGECARELLLEVAHDGRVDGLVEDGSYGNGPY